MENFGDLPAIRIKSKRLCCPITNRFFPSGLGVGLLNISGATVSCDGSPALRKKDLPSRNAQIFCALARVDSKRKYSPFGVQVPFDSAVGRFQSGNTARKFFPSADTSHNDDVRWLVSRTVKRKRRPSGENRSAKGTPATVINSRESLPSALQIYKLDCLAYTMCWPSGAHAAACARIFSTGRSDPAGTGSTQTGHSVSEPSAMPCTSNSERPG